MVVRIDGSMGEGGGQVLRSSLTLSMLTGKPIHITKIRAGRKKPGLLRQHLTATKAAAAISGLGVLDVQLGARELKFEPAAVRGGTYEFKVGSAGSAMLVLQTILLPLCLAKEPSELVLEGGTHNPWAPTFDFLDRAFLPQLRRMGPQVQISLERPGFYPAGGGRVRVRIEPVDHLEVLHLRERGEVVSRRALAYVANLGAAIGERELEIVGQSLGWAAENLELRQVDARGPGNALSIEVGCREVTEVFTGFGRAGVQAEQVAKQVCRDVRGYLASGVPVAKHLADQLLIPMAMAGSGSLCTLAPSRHTLTQIELLPSFMEINIESEKINSTGWLVTLQAPADP